MNEVRTRRLIMEAGKDSSNKTATLQLTFRGFNKSEVSEIENEFEKFWENVKDKLQLQDFSKDELTEEVKKEIVTFSTLISTE